MNLRCLRSITVQEPEIRGERVKTIIKCIDIDGREAIFPLRFVHEHPLDEGHLPLLRMAAVMPLLNYGLFTDEIRLRYSITKSDMSLLADLLDTFSRDIFINKIARRRADYILHEFLPLESDITDANARARARIVPESVEEDEPLVKGKGLNATDCGVLSSGGKESLLTYGMLKELGHLCHDGHDGDR